MFGIDWKMAGTVAAGILIAGVILAVIGGVARRA